MEERGYPKVMGKILCRIWLNHWDRVEKEIDDNERKVSFKWSEIWVEWKQKINEEEARDEFLGDAANGMNEWVDNRHVCMRMTVLHPTKKEEARRFRNVCGITDCGGMAYRHQVCVRIGEEIASFIHLVGVSRCVDSNITRTPFRPPELTKIDVSCMCELVPKLGSICWGNLFIRRVEWLLNNIEPNEANQGLIEHLWGRLVKNDKKLIRAKNCNKFKPNETHTGSNLD